jgi:hypothetical protein
VRHLIGGRAVDVEHDRPVLNGATNPHLARARAIARLTEPDDVVVHLGRGESQYLKVYVPYFAVRRSIVLEPYFATQVDLDHSLRAVRTRLAVAAGGPGRVVVLPDAIGGDTPALDFERASGIPEGPIASLFKPYRPQPLGNDPAVGTWARSGCSTDRWSETPASNSPSTAANPRPLAPRVEATAASASDGAGHGVAEGKARASRCVLERRGGPVNPESPP